MAKAEIISIGDEILIGQITNTNAQWMAQQLNLIGIPVAYLITVGDNREDMLQAFTDAQKRADIILITGGLGPTSDDITKPVLCEFFNTKLVFNEKCFEDVKKLFSDRGLYMPDINKHQAEIPENCIPIKNNHGTAPGMWFEASPPRPNDGSVGRAAPLHKEKGVKQIFVSLPGVPFEMKAMMEDFIIPELKKKFTKQVITHKTVHTQGIGESALAEKIKSWEESLSPLEIKLAYLPSPGMVKLRLSAKGSNKKILLEAIDSKINDLKKIIPDHFFAVEEFGQEPETLEKIVGELLREKKQTLAVAESCTGGYIGHLVTSIAGSSDYFKGGIIAYSNEVKINELGVDKKAIEEKGAVSREIAEQMAEGIKKRYHTDFGIGTTGIAGPAGGSAEKPVGTVWIAVSSPNKTISEKFSFGNNRERNIRKAAITALNMLRIKVENLT